MFLMPGSRARSRPFRNGVAAFLSGGNPAGTTSGTGVMMGLGSTFKVTPVYSSRLFVTIFMNASDNAGTGSSEPQLYYGTGTPPSNGAATTGTSLGTRAAPQSINANAVLPVTLTAVVTKLTPGVVYWFDVNLLAGGGTAIVTGVTLSAMEF